MYNISKLISIFISYWIINKYSYFLVNPLNDFLSSGFCEICKTKEWGIKSNFDLYENK